MKITVIGRWGAVPRKHEATAGYLIQSGDENILIDCGSGVMSCIGDFIEPSQITKTIITHTHFDHVADLGILQYSALVDTDLKLRNETLPIYIASDGSNAPNYASMKGSSVSFISEETVMKLDDLLLTFHRTIHDTYCLAIKIQQGEKTFVFTADAVLNDNLISFCEGADLVLAETSFYKEFEATKYGHMNTTDVAKLCTEANVRGVILTHLPTFGDIRKVVDEVSEGFNGQVTLANYGLSFTL